MHTPVEAGDEPHLSKRTTDHRRGALVAAAAYYCVTAFLSLLPAVFWALSLPYYISGDSSSDSGEAGLGIAFAVTLTLVWFLVTGFVGVGLSNVTGRSTARHFGFAVLSATGTLIVVYVALTIYLEVILQR